MVSLLRQTVLFSPRLRGPWLATLRHFLRRRYRLEVDQPNRLKSLEGPVLVFPNHPAYIDPPLILAGLRWQLPLRPLVYTDTFRHPMLRCLVESLRAVEIPELRRDSKQSARQMVRVLREVKSGLKSGESFLVYPSGRLQRDGSERLYSARAAFELIKAATPETQVVLLRTRGLWGSRFSCAADGQVPKLGSTMLKAIAILIANAWWWMPKRRVKVSHAIVQARSLQHLSRDELNRWLEAWYDSDGGESVSLVPTHFLSTLSASDVKLRQRPRLATIRGWKARAVLRTRRIRAATRNRFRKTSRGSAKNCDLFESGNETERRTNSRDSN